MDRRGLCDAETVPIIANSKTATSGTTQKEPGIRRSGGRHLMLVSPPLVLTKAVVAIVEYLKSNIAHLRE